MAPPMKQMQELQDCNDYVADLKQKASTLKNALLLAKNRERLDAAERKVNEKMTEYGIEK